MAERKLTTGNAANKMAMSRALGAAFLNHQVEQLEKSVNSNNGPASGNWRDRDRDRRGSAPKRGATGGGVNGSAKVPPTPTAANANVNGNVATNKKEAGSFAYAANKDREFDRSAPLPIGSMGDRRRSGEEDKKDADVVVVDASVLIHALYQVKKWCRDGREEIIIVPLEALNTLDLLKKGTTSLAQKARAASRILEAQVGANPRIRVQRDDAFVLWDQIAFVDGPAPVSSSPTSNNVNLNPGSCPEWVRRIICCARYETEHPEEETGVEKPRQGQSFARIDDDDTDVGPRATVVLATLAFLPSSSPQTVISKLGDMSLGSGSGSVSRSPPMSRSPVQMSPVPLPVSSHHHGGGASAQASRHEQRSNGALVTIWAHKAGVRVLEVEPSLPGRGSEEDREPRERTKRGGERNDSARERGEGGGRGRGGGGGGRGRRFSGSNNDGGLRGNRLGLVERPPAVMAMMEMVSQPSKVVRVLARGEKLEPGP